MSTATQVGISALLEQAGAHTRGNRHDCPKCGGLRTITHSGDCFYCHRCEWKGNGITLMRELGIEDDRTDAEKERDRGEREQAHEAARRLYAAAHKRQLELREMLRELGRLELRAHDAGPVEQAWNVLADVYSQQPGIEYELDALESDDPATVFGILNKREGVKNSCT
jgi:ribosomal protein L37AE/L43A